jgi:hypothetical protein
VEIEETVSEAKRQWLAESERATDRKGRQLLFSRAEVERMAGKTPQAALFDVLAINDEQFWHEAEAKVTDALQAYARHTSNGSGLRRQLFVDDAEQGFAFVDLCREKFDVVLMNPPFGEASKPSKGLLEKKYPRTKNDIYAAFVERGLSLLVPGGMLGAITSRTGFFLSSFQKWREQVLLKEARPIVVVDLGYGVLDTAMVETAAYCLEKSLQ